MCCWLLDRRAGHLFLSVVCMSEAAAPKSIVLLLHASADGHWEDVKNYISIDRIFPAKIIKTSPCTSTTECNIVSSFF